ncbi:hypothetical protein R5R35_010168 [Gryllus longicercus]|uniref:Uncharacterized protein n=1 Tax=Gryllus longicercus TaxID=2509291 RepID=A0AAN9V4D2_9ORTH
MTVVTAAPLRGGLTRRPGKRGAGAAKLPALRTPGTRHEETLNTSRRADNNPGPLAADRRIATHYGEGKVHTALEQTRGGSVSPAQSRIRPTGLCGRPTR